MWFLPFPSNFSWPLLVVSLSLLQSVHFFLSWNFLEDFECGWRVELSRFFFSRIYLQYSAVKTSGGGVAEWLLIEDAVLLDTGIVFVSLAFSNVGSCVEIGWSWILYYEIMKITNYTIPTFCWWRKFCGGQQLVKSCGTNSFLPKIAEIWFGFFYLIRITNWSYEKIKRSALWILFCNRNGKYLAINIFIAY